MACPGLRARFVTGLTCAAMLYISALLIAGCSDPGRSPIEPQVRVAAHGPSRDVGDGSCDPDYDDCSCDSQTALEGCSDNGGGGGDSGGDYGTIDTVVITVFTDSQKTAVDSALNHLNKKCGWVGTYVNSVPRAGGQFGYGSGVSTSPTSGDWGVTVTPKSTQIKGNGYYPNPNPLYPYYQPQIGLGARAFGNGLQQLAITIAHEASHGYWNTGDGPSSSDPNSPINGEDWGQYCWTP